jgi:hypothetical protein
MRTGLSTHRAIQRNGQACPTGACKFTATGPRYIDVRRRRLTIEIETGIAVCSCHFKPITKSCYVGDSIMPIAITAARLARPRRSLRWRLQPSEWARTRETWTADHEPPRGAGIERAFSV